MSIVNLSQISQALDAMMPELTPVPIGTIEYAHDVPEGWLECNGAAVSRTKYARLFKKIGTKYGAGDGSTTFNLPNLHHRVLEGTNTTSEVGQLMEAGLPDIVGKAKDIHAGVMPKGEQCFTWTKGGELPNTALNGGWSFGDFSFNASKSNAIFGGSDTVRMASLRALAIIKI